MLGRSLGNYGVVSKIGEGGMGVVYLARHVTLGRPAAVKVLRSALSSNQDVVSRFFNEARAATAVRHPGVIEVYDFGFLEDRTAYIIMEYLDGESLASRMRRGRSTIAVTLATIRAIARTLQAVHDHDIVHRDLKPDNVFLIPDSEIPSGDRVKLLDFGVAKLAPVVNDAHHTATGTVLGTPLYMSPEQCRGVGKVDHRADLYALGCIAYEMLCGQPPFAVHGSGDVIARHLYFEPPPLRSHRSDISPELEEIVLRLLKKDPKARYSSAAELIRAIDQLALTRADDVVGDFVPTLPMVPTPRPDTTLTIASSHTTKPRTEPRDRRLVIYAGAATVAIMLLVVVIIIVRGDGDGDDRAIPAALPAPGSAAPADAAVVVDPPPAESPSKILEANQSHVLGDASGTASPASRTPAVGSGATTETKERVEAPATQREANLPHDVETTASDATSASKRAERRTNPRPPVASVGTAKLWIRCRSLATSSAIGEHINLACQVGNFGNHPAQGVKYKVWVPNVPPQSADGPKDVAPHAASNEFHVDAKLPANGIAEQLEVKVTASAPPAAQGESRFWVNVVDSASAAGRGSSSATPR